jgi:hypothetical protein
LSFPLQTIPRGLLFWSVIYRRDQIDREHLVKDLGKVLPKTMIFDTELCPSREYYAKEMGPADALQRLILVSMEPVARQRLIEAKHRAYKLEAMTSMEQKRIVNIDPGLVTLEHVVLSTFKPYAHRLYVADSVFLELCLQYIGTSYATLPWTYPDYAEPQMIEFFNFLRSFLKREKTYWEKS